MPAPPTIASEAKAYRYTLRRTAGASDRALLPNRSRGDGGGIDWTDATPVMTLHRQRGICLDMTEPRRVRTITSRRRNSPGLLAAENRNSRCRPIRRTIATRCKAFRSSMDGRTRAQYPPARKVTNWWVYELKEPKRGSYAFNAHASFQKAKKAIMPRLMLQVSPRGAIASSKPRNDVFLRLVPRPAMPTAKGAPGAIHSQEAVE